MLSPALADSYKVLIEQAWKQYEITLIKLPEQYSAKAKQYLWMVSLFLAGKTQIAVKYSSSLYNLYSGDSLQFAIFCLFVASVIFDIFCFALGVRFLNANTIASMPLGSPYNTFLDSYQSSYKILYTIISEIHNGLESAQGRLKIAGKNLNLLGWAIAISVGLSISLVIALPNKSFVEESKNEQQKHSTSSAATTHIPRTNSSNQGRTPDPVSSDDTVPPNTSSPAASEIKQVDYEEEHKGNAGS